VRIADRKKRIMLFVLASIAIGFLLLTALVFFMPVTLLDREFSEEVQEHQNPLLDTAMKLVSWFGYMPNSVIVVLGTALLFFLYKYKREALFLVATMVSGFISSIVKLIVNRPRPSETLVRIIEKTRQQSFPSGHVLFYVVFFGFLTLLMFEIIAIPKVIRAPVGVICMLLIFVVPFSRIYLGAHWFTDVLGGFLLGVLILAILAYLYLKKKISPEKG
jgi:membrane-associated phospholipid phosphatase